MKENWDSVVRAISAQARVAYARQLSLTNRLQYLQLYLLSKIWHIAQTLPPLTIHVKQLTSVCSWYIWQGNPFRVPVTTTRRPKEQGGWALPDVGGQCRTLLSLIWKMGNKDGSLTAALMHHWNLTGAVPNPPLARRFPTKVAHFRQYNIDMAYVAPPGRMNR